MIANRGAMTALDRVAQRYGARPSALVGEGDAMVAWTIDLWAAQWGGQQDAIDMKKRQAGRGHGR